MPRSPDRPVHLAFALALCSCGGGNRDDDASFISSAGGWEVARVLVEDGVHQLIGDAPFSVAVVGYALADSYAYMGGSGTGLINPEPEG